MSTALDAVFVPLALELIDAFGVSADFTSEPGTFDAASMSAPDGTSLGSAKVSPPAPYETKYVDGDVIRATDARVLLAASGLSFNPTLAQQMTLGGTTFSVLAVRAIWSGEQIAAYELQVRS